MVTSHGEALTGTAINQVKSRRKTSLLRALSLAGAIVLPASLAACAEQTQPLEVSYVSSNGTELPKDLAEIRTQALEICNTGEDAAEVAELWVKYDFDKDTGMDFQDAFAYMADFSYDKDHRDAVISVGSTTYPLLAEIPDNCKEATYMVSKGRDGILFPDQALADFRETGDFNGALIRISNTIQENQ